ncbi:39S ribosomal protein L51, mitochondrial [Nowakowskiella sp. JEL0078]|nr:39S ribosomal protein L51, mitochondrial [Nowakowskiella sp. JEL0078]
MASPRKLIKQLEAAGAKSIISKPDLRSKAVNGVGAFVFPLQKLTFQYDQPRIGAGGTSKGITQFLLTSLSDFASKHPTVEICVERITRNDPKLIAKYVFNVGKEINCKGMPLEEVKRRVKYLAETSGFPDTKFSKPIIDSNSNKVMRPWDPFHSNTMFKP